MAMYNSGIRMKTKVSKTKLLKTLRENLSKHADIVQEAREGYVQKAKEVLEKRLEQIKKGEVVGLQFTLNPPSDHSEVYKNSIAMLEWDTQDVVELEADEFRQLVRDEWDWSDSFYGSTAPFSKKASDWINESVGSNLVAPPK